jgi:hypothetical protein
MITQLRHPALLPLLQPPQRQVMLSLLLYRLILLLLMVCHNPLYFQQMKGVVNKKILFWILDY